VTPGFLREFPRIEKLARQLISLYPLSSRLRPFFWTWYAFLQESEAQSVEELRVFQFRQLRELLLRLKRTSPFYEKRLANVPLDELTQLEDLQRLVPPLSREEFSRNYSELRTRNFNRRSSIPSATSGTTGNALQFFHPAINRQREWAAICHQWKRVGYDPVRSRRAEFRGLTSRGELYQEFPDQNMVRFSILDLRAEVLPRMAEVIASRQLNFYHGYPSAFYLLAQELLRSGLRFPQPEAILLASEMVYDFQLEQIQAAFPNTRLFAHYGCSEGTVLAGWCEQRRVYHVLPQYSLVETDPITKEILGTNLYNDINGFVRYRMTDSMGEVETSPCPACRRPYTPILVGLDGRQEDYLFSPDRGWIAPAIVTYPLKHLHSILELQFQQEDPKNISLNYVLRNGASREMALEELKTIESGLHKLMGNSIRLGFRQVENISRGPTGKYKWIVSRLDPPSSKGGKR
jgi:phenylacetate-CoA ligase